jgi:predicted PurR-regulated permease PerM
MTLPEVPRSAHDPSARLFVLALGVLIAIALAPVSIGLATALVLYEIWVRPYTWLARKIPSGLAAFVATLASFVLVAAPLIWLGHHLVARLPAVRAAMASSAVPAGANSAAGNMPSLQAQLAQAGGAVTDRLRDGLPALGHGAASTLVNWSIALLGLFYLLGSASAGWARVARILPLSPAGLESLRVRFRGITQGVVGGTLLSAAVQGVVIGTGFFLAGLPDPAFWGASAAIATLVPVVGNGLVWIPALALLLLRQHYEGAVIIAVFGGIFPGIIDRVVRATVSRHVGRVHPMITLVGALAGVHVAGVAGLILGPVALAMFIALVEVYQNEYGSYREPNGVDQSQST